MRTRAKPEQFSKVCVPGSELDTPEFSELLAAYAQAMWSWSRTENKLFLLFALLIGHNQPRVGELRATFFSVVSPAGRIDMIHAAASISWKNTQAWDIWVSLYTICKNELSTRGKIAHLVGEAWTTKGKTHALLVHHGWHPRAAMSYSEAKSHGYDASRLSAFARKWEELNVMLGVFLGLAEEVMKPQASAALIARLRQMLLRPDGLIVEEQKRRPQPSQRKP